MKTLLIKIGDIEKEHDSVALAGRILADGGLVAIPTETVYGLAGNAYHGDVVRRIYEAKGRPQDNPMIVHIAEASALDSLCTQIPQQARALALKFWPGPLTMVLQKGPDIPDEVTAGLSTVAVRCPSHPVARAIIKAAGVPLAAPSANLSGKPSPTDASHVMQDLSGKIDAVVDGGPCSVGLESTVIDMTCAPPRLLRPGGVTLEQLESVLGPVDVDGAVMNLPDLNLPVRSPGMKYRHYAPDTPVRILRGSPQNAAQYIRSHHGQNAAVLCFDEELAWFNGIKSITYGSAALPETLAHNLFSALRQVDDLHVRIAYARCPEGGGIALAVENRLKKAAGFAAIDV